MVGKNLVIELGVKPAEFGLELAQITRGEVGGVLGLRFSGEVPPTHLNPGLERNLDESKFHTLCEHVNQDSSCSLVVLILRRHCRDRGSSPHGVEKFISALKATKLQSTTSVSLVVVRFLHGSRVSVNRRVCSKCVSSPVSSAEALIASTWDVVSLDK